MLRGLLVSADADLGDSHRVLLVLAQLNKVPVDSYAVERELHTAPGRAVGRRPRGLDCLTEEVGVAGNRDNDAMMNMASS